MLHKTIWLDCQEAAHKQATNLSPNVPLMLGNKSPGSSNIYVLWSQNPFRLWSHLRQGRKDVLRQNLGACAHRSITENPSPLLLPKIQLPEQLGSDLVSQAMNTHKQPQHTLMS